MRARTLNLNKPVLHFFDNICEWNCQWPRTGQQARVDCYKIDHRTDVYYAFVKRLTRAAHTYYLPPINIPDEQLQTTSAVHDKSGDSSDDSQSEYDGPLHHYEQWRGRDNINDQIFKYGIVHAPFAVDGRFACKNKLLDFISDGKQNRNPTECVLILAHPYAYHPLSFSH